MKTTWADGAGAEQAVEPAFEAVFARPKDEDEELFARVLGLDVEKGVDLGGAECQVVHVDGEEEDDDDQDIDSAYRPCCLLRS